MNAQASSRGLFVYRRLLDYVLRHWRAVAVAIAGMLVYAATEVGFAALMKPMFDDGLAGRDQSMIRWISLAVILIFMARGTAGFFSTYLMSAVGRRVVKELRTAMFGQLLHMPASFYDENSSGQLISKLSYNAERVAFTATDCVVLLVRDTLSIVGLLAWMFYLNWILTLCLLLTIPFIAGLVMFVSKVFRAVSHKIQDSMGDITHVAKEMIEGHRVVKIFGGEDYEARQFEKVNERNRRLQMRIVATQAASTPIVQLIIASSLAGILFITSFDTILGSITVGTFGSFITAVLLLLQPARRLTNVNAKLQEGIAAGESIFELLDSEAEQDRPVAGGRVSGHIEYRNVCFSYDEAKGRVLQGVSFRVRRGQTVALVGHSGAGKSTLVNLLPRFYEPQFGEILIDDVNVRQYGLRDLRSQIAYVGQDVTLFNDSIADNIAYGREGDTTVDEIRRAAMAAHAGEFIDELPAGLNTQVGENGVLLSGGQRQRIAIARALLKDAPILILDEATSSLDTESERYIQAALEVLLKDRTTLVIAHRLSTIERADCIVVMRDGRIVDSGTHGELLAREGLYTTLYRMQFQEPVAPRLIRN
ncbi:MAG: lipid A export permease/ATP-binding protein MsbA [Gammaproteobacteria bacterium]